MDQLKLETPIQNPEYANTSELKPTESLMTSTPPDERINTDFGEIDSGTPSSHEHRLFGTHIREAIEVFRKVAKSRKKK